MNPRQCPGFTATCLVFLVLTDVAAAQTTTGGNAQRVPPVRRLNLLAVSAGDEEVRGLISDDSIRQVRCEVRQKRGDAFDVLERVTGTVEDRRFSAALARPLEGSEQVHVQGLDATGAPIEGAFDTRDVALAPPSQPRLIGTIRDGTKSVSGFVEGADNATTVQVRVYSSEFRPLSVSAGRETGRRAVDQHSDESLDSSRRLLQLVPDVAVAANGKFTATLDQAVVAGQIVEVTASASGLRSDSVRHAVDAFGDWGRVRTYFAGGAIFSKEGEQFSQQDLSLAFAMDKTWLQGCDGWLRNCHPAGQDPEGAAPPDNPKEVGGKVRPRQINTFFDVRLTTIPVSASTSTPATTDGASAAAGNQPAPSATQGDPAAAFLASKKVAVFHIGVYVPLYGQVTRWIDDGAPNTLFIAPVFRGGFQTLTEDQETGETTIFHADDVLHFWSVGIGVGHYRLTGSRNRAPELVSYLHITRGPWESFTDPAASVARGSWRWALEGRLKIPESPLQIGFDANLGAGRDDIRFIFGTRFDLGMLIAKLLTFEP